MDASQALAFITARVAATATRAEESRARLIKALEDGGGLHLSGYMEEVLKAEAQFAPWADLLHRIDRHGVRVGLAKQCARVNEALVGHGISMSTSQVTNAARLAEHDGLCRFLGVASGIKVTDDQVVTEEAAPEPEPQPAPAPAPTETPKVTPAQKRTLAAIQTDNIRLQGSITGKSTKVASDKAERPRKDMVEWVISQGWARVDTSCPLYRGQRVTLTAAGEDILAG